MPRRVAFLFLTLDDPHVPGAWDRYFAGNEHLVRIYIHPKNKAGVTWRADRVIADLHLTAWGRIVDAYLALFRAAFADRSNFAFVTISESCVPIKPFAQFYADLTAAPGVSLVKRMPVTQYDMGARVTSEVRAALTAHNGELIKHYARMCLVRADVRRLLRARATTATAPFAAMHVGDEFFLSSIMPLPDARDFAVTFDDWGYTQRQGRAIRGEIAALARLPLSRARSARIAELWRIFDAVNGRPKTITKVDAEDLRQMRATDAYFYRKFARGTDVEMYLGAFF